MIRIFFTALIVSGVSILQSCGPEKTVKASLAKDTGSPLTLEWIKGPSTGNPDKNRVRVLLPDELDDSYHLDSAGIYMGIHGHGGNDQDIKIEKDQEYKRGWQVSNFSFTMSGPWELNLKACSSDALENCVEWEVKVQVR